MGGFHAEDGRFNLKRFYDYSHIYNDRMDCFNLWGNYPVDYRIWNLESIVNNQELFEYMKSSHDYTIAEFQKSEQRIVDELQVMKLNIRSLEDSRTAAKWIIKTISKGR